MIRRESKKVNNKVLNAHYSGNQNKIKVNSYNYGNGKEKFYEKEVKKTYSHFAEHFDLLSACMNVYIYQR